MSCLIHICLYISIATLSKKTYIYRKTFFLKVLSLSLSLSLRVSLSLSSRGRHWIVCVVCFRNLYFMWVCEASEVNIWTVFAVGPNGANKNKNKNKTNKNNFASSRSDHRGPTMTNMRYGSK